ncbi:MAG: hypothetical protein ACW99R_15215 [Candidatus Hodarchaeales archaeon]
MKVLQSGMKEITLKNLKVDRTAIYEKPQLWRVGLILISWMAFIGIDFLWHAGILAGLYTQSNPALLEAWELFVRIPFGYLSFLVFVTLIYWLSLYMDISDWKNGMLFGIKFGVILGLATTLGQYSILTVDPVMMIGWGLGQTTQFMIIGGIIGTANSGISLKRLFSFVVILVIILVLLTIFLQIIGLAPPMVVIE